jgi:hypothetical protein
VATNESRRRRTRRSTSPATPTPCSRRFAPSTRTGHILFGFAGRSRTPGDHDRLLTGSVEIVDYLMEGFVPYLLSAERTHEGLKLVVRKAGTNRDAAVD